MFKETVYSKARKFYEEVPVGERISAKELANRIGVTTYQDRTKVAAFLSQQAAKGRAKKRVGKDKRMYYVKLAPVAKPTPSKVARVKDRSKDTITLEEIGESIVNYIERLKKGIEKLEKQDVMRKERLLAYSKQKEEFKRLYQEAEAKLRELSKQQPSSQKTIRVKKIAGD
jgi:hypothetical protein